MTASDNDRIFRKAKELGVSPQDESYVVFEERVLNAIRERRERRYFVISVLSAIASVLSALAAWFAVIK